MTMNTPTRLNAEQWIDRARSMAPLVAEHRDEAEMQRHLPSILSDAMRQRGLFCLWLPQSLGGPQLPIETVVRVLEELSRQDGAVGWNSMISSNHSILWARLPHDVAASMTQGGRNIIAGTIGGGGDRNAPGGGVATRWMAATASPANGPSPAAAITPTGWSLTAASRRTASCARLRRATWVSTPSSCSPPRSPCSTPGTPRACAAPAATTSKPQTSSCPRSAMFATNTPDTYEDSPIYSTSRTTPWSSSIAGVAIGIARDAVESFIDLAGVKPASAGPLQPARTRQRPPRRR